MPNFTNGKIYKLWSPEGDEIYIGSTVQSLSMRKAHHKRTCNNYNGRCCSSKILFEKYDDVRIELIEEFPCENKMELDRREGYFIRTLDCVNKRIAGRTQKEYDDDNKEKKKQYQENNKEKIKEKNKKWREANREKVKEYFKEYSKKYYEDNKEKIDERHKIYNENNKERYKEWCENNKEKIKEYDKQYREKNKEYLNQKKRERYAKKKNLVSVQSPVLSLEHSVE
jgi:hypothetical protein